MKSIPITRVQFQEFRALQQKRRWDWPATFSANPSGDVWPFVGNGYTPLRERVDVKGCSPVLKWVAEVYTVIRPEGGRFFIGDSGAFWKNIERKEIQFVRWDFGEEALAGVPEEPKFETFQELQALVAANRRRDRKERQQKGNQ